MHSIPASTISRAPRTTAAVADPLLSIRDLAVRFATRSGVVTAVDGVDLDVYPGECLGLVGESGSGKSVTFAAVMGLVRAPGRVEAGSIRFRGVELLELGDDERRALRGRDIAMTLQDALTALNPAFTVCSQITEVLLAHQRATSGTQARAQALELMRLVGIPAAEQRLDDYPHQFSGGMRQRIMIAIALACRPQLLIADEPTTALDVTIQAQVLELIARLREQLGMSMVLITHNLGVVAEYCDRIAVMYAGQIVESGPTWEVIESPRHPYTRGLLKSIPRLDRLGERIRPIEGALPDLATLGDICRFEPRCALRIDACRARIPMLDLGARRLSRCIRASEPGTMQ
jgi:oligopeptide/dipeptide ABC transporter ATP-binding protein